MCKFPKDLPAVQLCLQVRNDYELLCYLLLNVVPLLCATKGVYWDFEG